MWAKASLYIGLLGLVIIAGVVSPVFFSRANIINLLRQVTVNAIVAVGQTFPILTSGIDLSVGSIVGLSSVAIGLARYYGVWAMVAVGLIVGIAVGLLNGVMIVKTKAPPFVITLGTMVIMRGLALLLSKGQPLYMEPQIARRFDFLGSGNIGFMPISVVVLCLVAFAAHFVLQSTPFGRYLRGLGGNREAIRLAGINVDRVTVLVYIVCGCLAGLGGVIASSRISCGAPMLGEGFELNAIAAAVIGGTSLSGGVGGIAGTLVGALIIGIINNMLNLANVTPYFQMIVKGLIIIGAVTITAERR